MSSKSDFKTLKIEINPNKTYAKMFERYLPDYQPNVRV